MRLLADRSPRYVLSATALMASVISANSSSFASSIASRNFSPGVNFSPPMRRFYRRGARRRAAFPASELDRILREGLRAEPRDRGRA